MKIGVLCSGGDAPGMNACVRAVVRIALAGGHQVLGILRGYQGLLDEEFYQNEDCQPLMSLRSVGDWGRHGGAYLRSSRSKGFRTSAGREKAVEVLRRQGVDALIPIGGDGTIRGAIELGKIWDGKIVACPGTIDNDLIGSDYTIGFATAVQTAVEAIDKIRDTAESHERMFLVEVMGRHSGYIAAYAALAGAAEMVCIPETPTDIPQLVAQLRKLRSRKKESVMMVVAEGDEFGNAQRIGEMLQEGGSPFAMRIVVLGHLQRGGTPCPADRLLATQLGAWAVEAVVAGKTNVMVGRQGFACQLTELPETVKIHRPIPPDLLQLIDALSH